VDGGGRAYLTGHTESPNFPVTPDAYDVSFNGDRDIFVVAFGLDGTVEWSTYVGGAFEDAGLGARVDGEGDVVVAGLTRSDDFPTTPGAYDRTFGGESDAIVLKLSHDGRQLLWSTFVGSTADEYAEAVALDRAGNPVVSGFTLSANFPTTPAAYDRVFGGDWDCFVAKLSAEGSELIWSTFLGGTLVDYADALFLDAEDDVVVTGTTESPDFPTTPGAFDASFNGGSCPGGDGVATKLDRSGSDLRWSTFLGGVVDDRPRGALSDADGNVFVVGFTESPDFPTTVGSYDDTHTGDRDGFVARISASGDELLYGTFVGAELEDRVEGFTIDDRGDVLVTGPAFSPGFPTTAGSYDETYSGGGDGFVAKFHFPEPVAVWDPGLTAKPRARLQMTPNPFQDAARVTVDLRHPSTASLGVYDATGRRVRELASGSLTAGTHALAWDGRDAEGIPVASGVYYIWLDADGGRLARSLVVLR
jgi:hypothetical protein